MKFEFKVFRSAQNLHQDGAAPPPFSSTLVITQNLSPSLLARLLSMPIFFLLYAERTEEEAPQDYIHRSGPLIFFASTPFLGFFFFCFLPH